MSSLVLKIKGEGQNIQNGSAFLPRYFLSVPLHLPVSLLVNWELGF